MQIKGDTDERRNVKRKNRKRNLPRYLASQEKRRKKKEQQPIYPKQGAKKAVG